MTQKPTSELLMRYTKSKDSMLGGFIEMGVI